MDATAHFLPWLRVGGAALLDTADPLTGPLPSGGVLRPWLRVAGHDEISQEARLYGPGHITSIGPQVVTRTVPAPGTDDAETNYFPFVEMRPADLPWRFTPAAAGSNSALRPWLVLVVVRQQDGVTVGPETGSPLAVLRIEPPAVATTELPDLNDSSSWAHVQSTVEPAGLAAALAIDPSAAVARLICPRRLTSRQSWIACVVPAFEIGRLAGLGLAGSAADVTGPAWDVTDPDLDRSTLRLPVLYQWSFGTGPDGDFEALARRLAPDHGDTELGRVDLDITHPGPPLPERDTSRPVQVDFVGGLKSPGVRRSGAAPEPRAWFDEHLEPLLEQPDPVPAKPSNDYVPERDDPVLTPPRYASFQSGQSTVPDPDRPSGAWMRALNLAPELRALAGIGAQAVRANQEALMASAWAQAGAARAAQQALDFALLGAAAAGSLSRRISVLSEGTAVQLTRPLHPFIDSPSSSRTLARDLANGLVPRGLVSTSFLRATRPSRPIGRAWSIRTVVPMPPVLSPSGNPSHRGVKPRPSKLTASPSIAVTSLGASAVSVSVVRTVSVAASVTSAFLDATKHGAEPAAAMVLRYAATALPIGAWTQKPVMPNLSTAALTARVRAKDPTPVPDVTGPVVGGHTVPTTRPGAVTGTVVTDLSDATGAVLAALDPMPAVRARLLTRIPALASYLPPDGGLDDGLLLTPLFTDPLSRDVIAIDPRLLVPGIDHLAANRVAMLSVDQDYVAAAMAGANHELSRELVWREFPAPPSATFLHRFWDTGSDGSADIADIDTWRGARPGDNVVGVGVDALAVILVRGDLLRRYPDAHIYLVRAVWTGTMVGPDDADWREPLLQGRLDRSSRFYGFPVSVPDLRGDRDSGIRTGQTAGWYVAIEESATGPRFGLDAPADDGSDLITGATAWDDLTWGHIVARNGSLNDVSHIVAREPLPARTRITGDDRRWGHNAAHMAAITYQLPFRVLIHADQLLAS